MILINTGGGICVALSQCDASPWLSLCHDPLSFSCRVPGVHERGGVKDERTSCVSHWILKQKDSKCSHSRRDNID